MCSPRSGRAPHTRKLSLSTVVFKRKRRGAPRTATSTYRGHVIAVTQDQALGWRLRRHLLLDETADSVSEVVTRVLSLRAWPRRLARAAVDARVRLPLRQSIEDALEAGDLVRVYAWRGGSYVLTPATAAHVLAARAASRVWTTRRWQAQGHFQLEDWAPLREALREFLTDGPKTRPEIVAHLAGRPGLQHLALAATGRGADALYKPLHWWGDITFGPERDKQATFRLPPRPGPPAPDAATAIRWLLLRYLAAYGPAGSANLRYWFTEGLSVPNQMLTEALAELVSQGRVVETLLDGTATWTRPDDVAGLADAATTDQTLLLPAYDPWVFGPGTSDGMIVPPNRRRLMSSGHNPVIQRGVVVGTWRERHGAAELALFT